MNRIVLKGIITDIEYSHTINNVEYNRANLIVKRDDGKEDLISLRFKKFSCTYSNGDYVELVGNLRSFSKKLPDGKNKVEIYVFTYFDLPMEEEDENITNQFVISGKVCKTNNVHITKNGKQNLQFILANNIISEGNKQKINNYLPMVCWGKLAQDASIIQVNDSVIIRGQLHSRTYTKTFSDGTNEIRVAHEGIVLGMTIDYSGDAPTE